jgi:hypothetical protein
MDRSAAREAVDRLVGHHRDCCLWFLRRDYLPRSDQDRLRILQQIQRHGDRDAFRQAGELRRWLSADSSERSASS